MTCSTTKRAAWPAAALLLLFAAGTGCGETDQRDPQDPPPAGETGVATTPTPTPSTATATPSTTTVSPTTSDAGTANAGTKDAGAPMATPDAAAPVPTWTQIYTTLFANPTS